MEPNRVARLTVVETVYHTTGREITSSVSHQFSRTLIDSDEDVYDRHSSVGNNWERLDMGWLTERSKLSQILLINIPPYRATKPTDEEREEDAQRILEVRLSVGGGSMLVYPGESIRFNVLEPGKIAMRSMKGETRYRVYAVPR